MEIVKNGNMSSKFANSQYQDVMDTMENALGGETHVLI